GLWTHFRKGFAARISSFHLQMYLREDLGPASLVLEISSALGINNLDCWSLSHSHQIFCFSSFYPLRGSVPLCPSRARTVRDAPNAVRDAPNAVRDAPKAVRDAPNAVRDAPNAVRDAPNAVRDAPKAVRDAPNAVRDAPNAVRDAPSAVRDAPSAVRDAPNAVRDAPNAVRDAPKAVRDAPNAVRDAPNAVRDAPNAVRDAPNDHPGCTHTSFGSWGLHGPPAPLSPTKTTGLSLSGGTAESCDQSTVWCYSHNALNLGRKGKIRAQNTLLGS
uniref:Uncharacterized protein n=1 Tax=Catharus ustulatus TaxID=91951 RepID=A0A8C3V826_CATUS